MRARLATVLVLAAAASLAGLARADGAARGCRTVEKAGTTEAVFAHFATRAQADAFVNGVAAEKGFKGLVVEDDGCGDFEVENPSIRQGQRSALVLEAAQSALQISFEQTTPVDRPGRGFVNAVFGTASSVAAAERLRVKVAGVGFRYLDLVPAGRRTWRVLAPHLPVRSEASFRAEARSAKLDVTFVTK